MQSLKRLLIIVLLTAGTMWAALFWYLRNPALSWGKTIPRVEASSATLAKHVNYLTHLNPARSYDSPEGTRNAENYITAAFKAMGYETRLQDVPSGENIYHNIIVSYGEGEGDPVLRIVIGAHYDVDGHMPGADDNASGVAGLLEIARLFRAMQPKVKVPIEFVAYALEEMPHFGGEDMGSAVHADTLKDNDLQVKAMMSLEMIGYYSEASGSQHYPLAPLYAFYPWKGNFIAAVGSTADRELISSLKPAFNANSKVSLYSINAPAFIPGVDLSDHVNYWKHGWPAVMITDTAFNRNFNYHTAQDTADRLDYRKMAEVVRGLYAGILELAN